MFVGGIEGGGTTFVVSVAEDNALNIIDSFEYETGEPESTLDTAVEWFGKYKLCSLGIAMFGPLELRLTSPRYGSVLATPKQHWRNFNILEYLKKKIPGIPMSIQSDVNAAALAELVHGQHGSITSCAYITVGTGIGAGICIRSSPLVGHSHPEAGHISVRRRKDDPESAFKGVCSFHGDCIEGLCCAAAIATRAGLESAADLSTIAEDHPVWDIVGGYLGDLCAQLVMICSPQVIVLGGGVLHRKKLFGIARAQCVKAIGGYLDLPCDSSEFIVPTKLEATAGVVGSLELGFQSI